MCSHSLRENADRKQTHFYINTTRTLLASFLFRVNCGDEHFLDYEAYELDYLTIDLFFSFKHCLLIICQVPRSGCFASRNELELENWAGEFRIRYIWHGTAPQSSVHLKERKLSVSLWAGSTWWGQTGIIFLADRTMISIRRTLSRLTFPPPLCSPSLTLFGFTELLLGSVWTSPFHNELPLQQQHKHLTVLFCFVSGWRRNPFIWPWQNTVFTQCMNSIKLKGTKLEKIS